MVRHNVHHWSRIVAASLLAGACGLWADEWPQWRGPSRDGVWRESGLRQTLPEGPLVRRWAVPVGGGYSGPTVAGGRVYLTDYQEEPAQQERVLCFQWETGKTLWSHAYPCDYRTIGYKAGPRASVLVHEGLAYSLGAVGHLGCFDAATGELKWLKDLNAQYDIQMPNWGIAASPLVEKDLLIVMAGGKDGCILALDRLTGVERWRALADGATYAAPVVVDQAGRRVVICWTAQRLVGLDAADGKLLWEHPVPYEKYPIAIATPVLTGNLLLGSEVNLGTLLLRLAEDRPSVELLWHRRTPAVNKDQALHCLMSTPQVAGDHLYGADGRGVLRCLKLSTGEQVWSDTRAVPQANWSTIHLVRQGETDRYWLLNERGELILADLTPAGYREIGRSHLLAPTRGQLNQREGVVWSHPAFAHRHIFARNDEELVCVDLSEK